MRDKITEILNKGNPLTGEELSSLLKRDGFQIEEITAALNDMTDCGDLVLTKKGKYALPQIYGLIKGTVRGNQRGFAFLLRDDGGQDIFIPARKLANAYDGDKVFVKLSDGKVGDSPEGEVVKILLRGRSRIIGVYLKSGKFGFVVPDDKRFSDDVYIGRQFSMGAKNGDKVVAEILDFSPKKRNNPTGKIVEVLGKSTDAGIDILSIIKSRNLRTEFPEEVVAEAVAIPQIVPESAIKNRRDFTKDLIFTIDGEDAKDLDDAVSIKRTDYGYLLGVHIADVSEYVKRNSPIDKEALQRGTSVYFPDRVLPMLPRELSNGICSLNEGVDRLTLSVVISLDKTGKVLSHELFEGVIRSVHRMTYTSVTKMIDGDPVECAKYKDILPSVKLMAELASILTENKTARGSIDFDMPECKIIVDERGKVVSVEPYERTLSHRIIEEFMILANETVAEAMFNMQLPFVYRVHEKPSEEKLEGFKQLLNALGHPIKTRGEIHSKQFLEILENVKDLPVYSVVNRVMLRTMQKAKYATVNIGHFGLASKCYCHFTSPIRRYPDLMVHRIIKFMLHGKLDEEFTTRLRVEAAVAADRSSECEKQADEAERDADNLKKAEYMRDKIGEVYDGVISGVTNFGIFVELPNTVEGLIKIDKLPKDAYNYMENSFTLKGAHHAYRIGDFLKIKVDSVNVDSMRVEFGLYEDNNAE